MIRKYFKHLILIVPLIVNCSYPKWHHRSICSDDPEVPQDCISCWQIIDYSFALIKNAYENEDYAAILQFVDKWKFLCTHQSRLYEIRLLAGIKLNQDARIYLDTFFISNLRGEIGNYIDNNFTTEDIKWPHDSSGTSISQWLKDSFRSIADTINRNSVYYPLSLYLCGKKDSSFLLLENDSAGNYSPFTSLYKEIKSSLLGIKIVVPDNYSTIQEAVRHAKERDTIFIRNGSYKTNCVIDKQLIIIGESRASTLIHGYFRKPSFFVKASDSSTLEIVESSFSNLTFKNCTWGIVWANMYGKVQNCTFYSNGIGIISLITLPTIKNSFFIKNSVAGIYLESSRATRHFITNNVFAQNGTAIRCLNRTEVSIRNNIFYNNFHTLIVEPEARRTQFTYNDIIGSTKKLDPSILKSADSNFSITPTFVSPGPPLFDYSLKNGIEFKGKGFNQEDIGIQTGE
jgi:hypothetical protein